MIVPNPKQEEEGGPFELEVKGTAGRQKQLQEVQAGRKR